MPRVVEVTVPAHKTDALLAELAAFSKTFGVQVQRGAGVKPPGDVITIQAPNRCISELHILLGKHGAGRETGTSITSSDLLSVISSGDVEWIVRDSNESTWEEVEQQLASESNMTLNMMLVMACAGAAAATGIAVNALHLVIGAMVIAPGFEPLSRIALGLVTRRRAVRHGLVDLAKGYAALLAGAVLAGLVLMLTGLTPLAPRGGYDPPFALISFWTQITPASIMVSLAAALAGGILVVTHRAVLTAGVMIALALIPTVAIAGLAMLDGNVEMLLKAAARWLFDVVAVVLMSWLVFLRKRTNVQKREMLQ